MLRQSNTEALSNAQFGKEEIEIWIDSSLSNIDDEDILFYQTRK